MVIACRTIRFLVTSASKTHKVESVIMHDFDKSDPRNSRELSRTTDTFPRNADTKNKRHHQTVEAVT